MTYGFGWTSPPIRTIEVPEPDAAPLELPDSDTPEVITRPDPVPVGVP
jgi:hypothetical protein